MLALRQPLTFFWNIQGKVLVGHVLAHLSFSQVICVFYAVGLLLLLLGTTGWVKLVMPLTIIVLVVQKRTGHRCAEGSRT